MRWFISEYNLSCFVDSTNCMSTGELKKYFNVTIFLQPGSACNDFNGKIACDCACKIACACTCDTTLLITRYLPQLLVSLVSLQPHLASDVWGKTLLVIQPLTIRYWYRRNAKQAERHWIWSDVIFSDWRANAQNLVCYPASSYGWEPHISKSKIGKSSLAQAAD